VIRVDLRDARRESPAVWTNRNRDLLAARGRVAYVDTADCGASARDPRAPTAWVLATRTAVPRKTAETTCFMTTS
jgi:hypothetical protein